MIHNVFLSCNYVTSMRGVLSSGQVQDVNHACRIVDLSLLKVKFYQEEGEIYKYAPHCLFIMNM